MDTDIRIMIVAGEPSGDRIGALLAKSLLKKNPSIELSGLGGPMMKASGVTLVEDMTRWAVVGLIEVLKHYRIFKKIFNLILNHVDEKKPDLVVLVDFPGFNLRLAKVLHQKGVRMAYYVGPQIWAWGKRRVHLIKKIIDRMIVILPFEQDFYLSEGVPVNFVGHPLVDYYESYEGNTDLLRNGSGKGPVIAILPGSRANEIDRHMNILLEAAGLLKKKMADVSFMIPCATDVIYDEISKKVRGLSYIQTYRSSMKECLEAADFAWVCSGTATLEVAYFKVPMIVFYNISPLTGFLIRRLIQVPFVGLVNLVAQREIVPEILQSDFKPQRVVEKTLNILSDEPLLKRMREELSQVREKLGNPGASERAAQIILGMVSNDTKRKYDDL